MYNILLVDDEPVIKMEFRDLLDWKQTPYRIVGMVGSGEEALSFVAATHVDILITDLKMPQMNGLELIKRLKARAFSGVILVLSNYSDFALVREALLLGAQDYMLKVNMNAASMQALLDKLCEKPDRARQESKPEDSADSGHYRRMLLCDWLREAHPDEAVASMPQNALLPHAPYMMLNVLLKEKAHAKPLPLKSVRNVLLSMFGEDTDVLRLSNREYVCLVPVAAVPSVEEYARRKSVQITRQLQMYLDSQCCVLYAPPADDASGLRRRYQQLRQAQQILFYTSYPAYYDLERLRFSSLEPGHAPYQAAEELVRLCAQDKSKVEGWIDELLRACAQRLILPAELLNYLFQIVQVLLISNPQSSDRAAFAAQVDILTCPDVIRLKELLLQLLPPLLDKPVEERYARLNRDVSDVLIYLQRHYAERLTLDDIAVTVNLDKSYLCRLFKKETGESVFQHLCGIRMKRAAELIADGGRYIREISTAVGIEDPYYFARAFRKYYGVSPTEYRAGQKALARGEKSEP